MKECEDLLFEEVKSNRPDLSVVKDCIDDHADFNTRNNSGATVLHIACYNRHAEIVEMLIDSGADINAIDEDNKTPLYYARKNGFTEIVKILTAAEK